VIQAPKRGLESCATNFPTMNGRPSSRCCRTSRAAYHGSILVTPREEIDTICNSRLADDDDPWDPAGSTQSGRPRRGAIATLDTCLGVARPLRRSQDRQGRTGGRLRGAARQSISGRFWSRPLATARHRRSVRTPMAIVAANRITATVAQIIHLPLNRSHTIPRPATMRDQSTRSPASHPDMRRAIP
jgi:hypothetical protein